MLHRIVPRHVCCKWKSAISKRLIGPAVESVDQMREGVILALRLFACEHKAVLLTTFGTAAGGLQLGIALVAAFLDTRRSPAAHILINYKETIFSYPFIVQMNFWGHINLIIVFNFPT